MMRIGSPHAGRGHPPRAGPAPAVPPLVAGEPRGGRKRRLPLGFVRAAAHRTRPWVVGHRAASGIPSVHMQGTVRQIPYPLGTILARLRVVFAVMEVAAEVAAEVTAEVARR